MLSISYIGIDQITQNTPLPNIQDLSKILLTSASSFTITIPSECYATTINYVVANKKGNEKAMLILGFIGNGSERRGQCLLNENGFKYWKSNIKVLKESFKYTSSCCSSIHLESITLSEPWLDQLNICKNSCPNYLRYARSDCSGVEETSNR